MRARAKRLPKNEPIGELPTIRQLQAEPISVLDPALPVANASNFRRDRARQMVYIFGVIILPPLDRLLSPKIECLLSRGNFFMRKLSPIILLLICGGCRLVLVEKVEKPEGLVRVDKVELTGHGVQLGGQIAPKEGSVNGGVTDTQGKALGGASVSVGNKSVKTTEGGTYEIGGLSPGPHRKRVEKEGFHPHVGQVEIMADTEVVEDVLLAGAQGARSGAIEGKIRTGDGQPVPKVRVQLLGTPAESLSDETGYFRFSGVWKGTRCLVYEKKGFRSGFLDLVVREQIHRVEVILLTEQEYRQQQWNRWLEDVKGLLSSVDKASALPWESRRLHFPQFIGSLEQLVQALERLEDLNLAAQKAPAR